MGKKTKYIRNAKNNSLAKGARLLRDIRATEGVRTHTDRVPGDDARALFARKLSLLRDAVFSKADAVPPQENAVVFLSLSDALSRAKVFCGKGADIETAWEDAADKAEQCVRRSAPAAVWLKADVVTERERVFYEDFLTELFARAQGNKGAYAYPCGVAFDDDFEAALLSGEFNSCDVWAWPKKEQGFKTDNLRARFAEKGVRFTDVPKKFIVFKTMGFVADENDRVFELRCDDADYGRRIVDFTRETAVGLIERSTDFLLKNQKEDGSFVYGYISANQNTLTSYNILRHAGSALSVMQRADLLGEDFGSAIKRANDFLIANIRQKDESTAFVADGAEIKLGGNGIAAVAFAAYGEFFGSNPYIPIVQRLANGILEMQESDGSYFHVLHTEDFSRKERNRIVYYDGEATYALAKAYSLTGDERYLKAAEKAVRFFIDNEYEKFRDHWIAYALNEVTKHVHKQAYFDFALRNAQSNLDTIFKQATPYHTYLELLMAAFNTFKRLKILCENDASLSVPDFFGETDLARTIWKRAVYMQNYYYYPEFAMYMKRPGRIAYTFNVRHQNWRVRIDDIQHFVGGYYEFCKNFRLLAKYLDGYGFSDEGIERFTAGFGRKPAGGVLGRIRGLWTKR
ncbi:MAG: terpene cyclase/mutase family protein [Clostridiales Family XIII bacterium]|jgi:hypothetical protein|nr:terpene cyclase/mutase family protein [Clostridiales Family XIII bacterium]